ncbi:nitrous oxide reductase accessory protein NosL [Campylobacter sp. faydin G-105]|uniref:nitrous oxide reductase accessory protein NosL n=1 Tax=Campylobacter anatolicus TaxID=2829105 RepID=UPI001BA1A434|nr:nitrous oxide reductase accessory protein NosL [Campylobacter anatolicus]MBR8461330.1 nitrous oxide reductase accessory protein NosL [Campylobacter anatolicus]
MLKILFASTILIISLNAQMFQSVEPSQATLIQSGKGREYCPNCGMNLVKFYKTNHALNGKQYSSLHCLFEATNGQIPTGAMVVDTKNLNFIDTAKAFYVVGSKIKGTMTQNSKYAFSTEADAKEFQAENGGEIMDFKAAYKVAGADFNKDNEMIKAKREGGVYKKGREFYEQNCPRVSKRGFENIAELKAKLKSVCKNSDDAALQAAALYIWDNPKLTTKQAERIKIPDDAKCPVCGMLVAKNPNWAAMIQDKDKSFYFDGVKDLMKYYFQNDKKFDKIFVSDYYKLHKIEAKKAFYVIGSNVFGPMGDELVPFEKESDAREFAKDHLGKAVLKFDEIDEKVIREL